MPWVVLKRDMKPPCLLLHTRVLKLPPVTLLQGTSPGSSYPQHLHKNLSIITYLYWQKVEITFDMELALRALSDFTQSQASLNEPVCYPTQPVTLVLWLSMRDIPLSQSAGCISESRCIVLPCRSRFLRLHGGGRTEYICIFKYAFFH